MDGAFDGSQRETDPLRHFLIGGILARPSCQAAKRFPETSARFDLIRGRARVDFCESALTGTPDNSRWNTVSVEDSAGEVLFKVIDRLLPGPK
jgi:hypothetical protein